MGLWVLPVHVTFQGQQARSVCVCVCVCVHVRAHVYIYTCICTQLARVWVTVLWVPTTESAYGFNMHACNCDFTDMCTLHTHIHTRTFHRVWVILLCVNATASNATTTSLKLPQYRY